MISYENLSIEELRNKLKEQEDLFEEVTEERDIVVAQHNIHLPGCTLGKYQSELDGIQKKIDTIRALIEKYEKAEK
jgi:predicted translin family RNA/ssDNA-binding protein